MALSGQITLDRDRILVERFLSGEREAFDELFACHREKVYAIALGVLGNPEDAQDTLQETFALVHRHLTKFDGRSRFSTWLYRVAVNAAIGAARKRNARPKTVPLSDTLTVPATPEPDGDPLVHKCLGELDAGDRALLALFYWEELSLEEIAEIVGCSANAAKTRLFRARERFKTRFLANGGEGGP